MCKKCISGDPKKFLQNQIFLKLFELRFFPWAQFSLDYHPQKFLLGAKNVLHIQTLFFSLLVQWTKNIEMEKSYGPNKKIHFSHFEFGYDSDGGLVRFCQQSSCSEILLAHHRCALKKSQTRPLEASGEGYCAISWPIMHYNHSYSPTHVPHLAPEITQKWPKKQVFLPVNYR